MLSSNNNYEFGGSRVVVGCRRWRSLGFIGGGGSFLFAVRGFDPINILELGWDLEHLPSKFMGLKINLRLNSIIPLYKKYSSPSSKMGSLQESLFKFNKQQEKCQTIQISIAKQNLKGTPLKSTTSSMSTPSAPAKFSNDIERLQYINNIRKTPVGAQMKRVIDLLLERRQAMDPEEINRECYVDVNANKAVFDSLKQNPKVNYDGRRFSYKPTHDVRNKDQLLELIRKFQEGIAAVDLKDSYSNVMQDLQSLKASGQIWLLLNCDSRDDIAYPNNPKVTVMVDNDLKQLFRGVELPGEMLDIEKDLQKNGMKPATNTAKRRAMAQVHGISNKPKTKKKKLEISRRTKLTNSHLMHLFQ
ncbi:OLC1v1029614C1 [Oldenlandia corymbosa var. corymbosa]|uniref:OLC1v1029614C1 n=1 Tax=Oldenlandia corymbosa var. corymbosa TaxID=529605 RepID=A0AAV1CE77_OLDCO|nr:OLC1v1029614C1 [Oldenlandia corymbosa var. corymbosa]